MCSLVDRHRHLKGTCCLNVKNLKMGASSPSETLVPIYQTIWHHISKDIILNVYTSEIISFQVFTVGTVQVVLFWF
jgi:hypothetical protein